MSSVPSSAFDQPSENEEETLVLLMIGLLFFALGFFYFATKLSIFARYSTLLPLFLYLALSSADALYHEWVESSNVYGNRGLEYALTRLVLLTISTFFVSHLKPASSTDSTTTPTTKIELVTLLTIGLVWGAQECFLP